MLEFFSTHSSRYPGDRSKTQKGQTKVGTQIAQGYESWGEHQINTAQRVGTETHGKKGDNPRQLRAEEGEIDTRIPSG